MSITPAFVPMSHRFDTRVASMRYRPTLPCSPSRSRSSGPRLQASGAPFRLRSALRTVAADSSLIRCHAECIYYLVQVEIVETWPNVTVDRAACRCRDWHLQSSVPVTRSWQVTLPSRYDVQVDVLDRLPGGPAVLN